MGTKTSSNITDHHIEMMKRRCIRYILLYKTILFCLLFASSVFANTYSYSEILTSHKDYKEAIELGITKLNRSSPPPNNIIFEDLKGGFSFSDLFVFHLNGEKYVLRLLPSKKSLDFRQNEILATGIASQLDIAPKLLFSDPENLIIIMPFIQGHTLTKKDLTDENILKKLGEALRKLHQYSGNFPQIRTQTDRVKKHYERGQKKNIAYPSSYQKIYDNYIKENTKNNPHVFSHGDLNPSNIMVTHDRIYFIDWSSATWDDPYNDLAYLSWLSGMDPHQSKLFLQSYLGRNPTSQELDALCLAQKRTTFLTASVWLDFSESPEERSKPKQQRIEELDRLLASSDLKTGFEYINEGIAINPKTASSKEIRLYALGFLKEYLHWKCRSTK